MAKKIQLALTLSVLATLSFTVLQAVYADALKVDPPKEADTADKMLTALLEVAEPAPETEEQVKPHSTLPTFEHKKKKYRVLIPKVDIPGFGVRTALELATDTPAIEHLIKIQCVGTVIAEV